MALAARYRLNGRAYRCQPASGHPRHRGARYDATCLHASAAMKRRGNPDKPLLRSCLVTPQGVARFPHSRSSPSGGPPTHGKHYKCLILPASGILLAFPNSAPSCDAGKNQNASRVATSRDAGSAEHKMVLCGRCDAGCVEDVTVTIFPQCPIFPTVTFFPQ